MGDIEGGVQASFGTLVLGVSEAPLSVWVLTPLGARKSNSLFLFGEVPQATHPHFFDKSRGDPNGDSLGIGPPPQEFPSEPLGAAAESHLQDLRQQLAALEAQKAHEEEEFRCRTLRPGGPLSLAIHSLEYGHLQMPT